MVEARPPSNFVDRGMFQWVLQLETLKATRLRYCVSLLCIGIDGGPVDDGNGLTRRVAVQAVGRLRATDVAAALAPGLVGVLLVDAETGTLPAIFARATEGLVLDCPSSEGRKRQPTLSAGGASFPRSALGASELLRQATALMNRARGEGGDCLRLPS